MNKLSGVEELLADYFAILYTVHTNLIHVHAWHAFHGDVRAHGAGKIIAPDDWLAAPARMHFFCLFLKLGCFFANSSNALYVCQKTTCWLDAHRVVAVQLIYNLIVLAHLGQFVKAVGNF